MTTSPTMFYGSPTMSPPSKSKLKRQSRLLSHMLSRTLSYKDRSSDSTFPNLGASDDPAELSTQLSAPGVLKVFGDNVCTGAHYKSVLATASSSAQELVKEALERYALNAVSASQYVLCDVVGRFGGLGQQWQAEGLRVLRDNEKPLLIQDLWKPREGFSRRFELRKRSEVEELAARDVDTITAGINAQARKLQKNRAKGATTLTAGCKRNSTPPTLRRTVSETSLNHTSAQEEEPKGHYPTLLDPSQSPEDPRKELPDPVLERNNSSSMRYSLYQSPHLLLLQGYSQQHEKTKELAEKQSQHQDPISLSRLTIADLLPDLQYILFWMSNSIELLYFVQQKSPLYIQSMEEELDVRGSKESLFSSTITASEEAMTVLEEVIMYTFQQCVYYISKILCVVLGFKKKEGNHPSSQGFYRSLYVSLPILLECIPFQNESRESWCSVPQLPEELRRIVSIYQATLDLLQQYEVHPEIASQMFAYLFFFSNTLLFNQLLDKGPTLSCFHWPKGVQVCARLRQLLEWAQSMGFGPLAEQFFKKLSCTVNLLATPSAQLIQMTWSSLRTQFPELSPAQLHRLLTQYQLASDIGSVTAWEPLNEDRPKAFKTEDVLESYDNHPPIVLPSGGFKVDLEVECLDDNIYRHLLYIRHFLWSLQSKSSHARGPEPENLKGLHHTIPEGNSESPNSLVTSKDAGDHLDLKHSVGTVARAVGEAKTLSVPTSGVSRAQSPGRTPLLEKLKPQNSMGRSSSKMNTSQGDSSCLLTPPNTPLNFEPRSQDSLQPSGSCEKPLHELKRNGLTAQIAAQEGDSPTPFDYPTPASSSRSSATDDFCYAFVVELEKGPIGLGMGLIDGLHTPLNAPGIYIRTLIQDSPAASDGRLSLGDRILAVNGTSLIGTDYQSAVDLIRSGGKKLRFLVAKSDIEITKKISSSASPS
ncbi:ras-associating and dilute domain-containing protein isoform X3 [Sarcophilus harrisii]|uniref:ras-associating and dilute domain-containing protein isoform X3 n=1 Tax=Sarcophilus harrisii TaxID=9305 RepID=UPI001301B81A|nr:ras-associating and dilute domain-containing protein isoform X3 [Sarcophilus harrisii]